MNIVNSILKLKPGVYVLRHPKNGMAPISVTRAPQSPTNVGILEVIGTPKTQGTHLYDGSDCIVLHVAAGPVELVVAAFLPHEGAAVPALRLDQIGLDNAAPASTAPAKSGQIAISGKGISVIGHVEKLGDLAVNDGGLLGEPAQGLRIEGFQVEWPDRPDGIDLAYNIAVEGFGALPVVKTGTFCGTRGQARRITEVTFALIGPEAARYTLDGTAYFSGGFQVPVVSGQPLGGPSGLEHLSGLRLAAKPAAAARASANPWDESPRTKVFKAKATQAEAAPAKQATPKAATAKPAAKKAAAKAPVKVVAKKSTKATKSK
jgi:hypothetical protein